MSYTNIEDRKRDYFQRKIPSTDTEISKLRKDFYLKELSLTEDATHRYNVEDLFMKWLISKGITKTNIEDMWFNYLGSLGYTQDNISSREYIYYSS